MSNEQETQAEESMTDKYFKDHLLANEKIKGVKYHKLFNYLVNSLNTGYAPTIVICGRYGSGKSMTALDIGKKLHNDINVLIGDIKPAKQLCYNVLDFLQLINTSKRQFIIFDDAGVNLNSLDMHSKFSRAVVNAVSTQRYRENIYCFVLGKLYKLNPRLRDILDIRLVVNQTANSNPTAKITIFKPKWGKIDSGGSNRSKVYLKRKYRPKMPPEKLKINYRQKEMHFKNDIIDDMIEELKAEKNKKQKENKTVNF